MLRRIIVGSVAAAALTVPAPAALADEPTYGCDFQVVETTNGAHQAVVWGYVVDPADTNTVLRCYIAVNGSEVVSTSPEPIGPVAFGVTQGQFSAGNGDVVSYHAYVCTDQGCFTHDYETEQQQIPPQEVYAAICGVTTVIGEAGLNVLGLVVVEPGGDVYLAHKLVIDC